ncbi:hypothetical protein E1264_30135 [Actinomadura sp. KC216]|uniref:hypothetical protein n=1 Tax=Actinomadura sp. KC216 TaxID=2530370 RepID=UPI0010452786|nr:hypothetical protein [Actinomadura sp. KC216]TDB83004.1 hypothetical protein E1264_30135 [Actinomadura sp. KC216]
MTPEGRTIEVDAPHLRKKIMSRTATAESTAEGLADALTRLRGEAPIGNRFYERMAAGRLTLDDVRGLIRVEAKAAAAEITAYSIGGFRHRHEIFMPLSEMAYSAWTKLPAMARALDLSEEHLDGPWKPETFSYPGYLCWTALHYDQADFGMALYADLERYQAGSRQIADGFRTVEFTVPDEVIEYYDSGVPDRLAEKALAFVQEGLDDGGNPVRACNAGRVMEEIVGQYWTAAISAHGPDDAGPDKKPA